jgi:hypothetical protein
MSAQEMKSFTILLGVLLGCSGEVGAGSAQSGTPSASDGGGGAGALPSFCDDRTELRQVPEGECDFDGLCQVRVAHYCDDPQAANRKRYDCQCNEGEYHCVVTESGLSIDDTCP